MNPLRERHCSFYGSGLRSGRVVFEASSGTRARIFADKAKSTVRLAIASFDFCGFDASRNLCSLLFVMVGVCALACALELIEYRIDRACLQINNVVDHLTAFRIRMPDFYPESVLSSEILLYLMRFCKKQKSKRMSA